MKVKSLFIAVMALLGSLTASAQSEGDFRVGVGAGMNVSQLTNTDLNSRLAFNVGLRGEYYFTDDVYLGTGLLFSWQGARITNYGFTTKFTPGYLQIPLHAGVRMGLSRSATFFGEFGPYVAVGVCGKSDVPLFKGMADEDFFGDPDEGYARRFDCGLGLRAGVEISRIQIGVGYDFGLVKIYKEGESIRNGNFNLGVAYMF